MGGKDIAKVTAMTPTATRDTHAKEVSFRSKGETLPATFYDNSSVAVVLCPPHPLYGGNRKDARIVRVARELASHNISALCVDFSISKLPHIHGDGTPSKGFYDHYGLPPFVALKNCYVINHFVKVGNGQLFTHSLVSTVSRVKS